MSENSSTAGSAGDQADRIGRLKVVHLSSVHRALDTRVFFREARALAAAGGNPVVIAQYQQSESIDGVRILALPAPRSRLARMLGTTARIWRMARAEDAAIYQFHDPELLGVGLMLRLSGRSVIYDVHEDVPRDLLEKQYLPRPVRRLLAVAATAVEFIAGHALNGIVVATPAIARRFPAGKTIVVQNFPDPLEFGSEVPYSDREPLIGYVGGIEAIRGAREMVGAMALLDDMPEARLLLGGVLQPTGLLAELSASPGWRRVDYLRWLSRPEVGAMLGRVRIGLAVLHPTSAYMESYPVKLFEYMAAGIPVIASDFPLWRDIVSSAGAGLLVDPLDPAAIAAAIRRLLRRPDEAERMGQNGRRAVLDRFNWQREAGKLLGLYERVAKRPG